MNKPSRKPWILAYLIGVGVLSGGVTIACTYETIGTFSEKPSSLYGAYLDTSCVTQAGVPNCGYYHCISSVCGTYSFVQGCTTFNSHDMYQYMQMGCRSQTCDF
jgi:hypothetical protein